MAGLSIRNFMPRFLRNPLWGNREQWGLTVNPDDQHWQEWQETYARFYIANQREGIGTKVNDAEYRVMADIDLNGKTVLDHKIICWEHPNFANEILRVLDGRLIRQRVSYWPLPWLPLLDPNLVIRLQYRKK